MESMGLSIHRCFSLYATNAEMASSRDLAIRWHREQSERVSSYKPARPEISGDHGCAGECTISVPPPPGREGFASAQMTITPAWYGVMSLTVILYSLLTWSK